MFVPCIFLHILFTFNLHEFLLCVVVLVARKGVLIFLNRNCGQTGIKKTGAINAPVIFGFFVFTKWKAKLNTTPSRIF